MHANVPSINMKFPVYARICNQYEEGVCIDSLDQQSIQNAINTLIGDEQNRDRIAKECETAKSYYNWENESSNLSNLIRKYI